MLSIILVTKNRGKYLTRFFQNIESQRESCQFETELIVIDGGSTDCALEVIHANSNSIAYWVSEQDTGVSEAARKGFAKAKGEIIKFVGDEDEFYPRAFVAGVEYLWQNADVDCVVFHADWVMECDKGLRTEFEMAQPNGTVTLRQLLEFPHSGSITPEAAFFRRRAFARGGHYRDDFYIWAYLDLWFRHVKNGCNVVVVPKKIMVRIQTPDSSAATHMSSRRWKDEFFEVVRMHGGIYWVFWHRMNGDLSFLNLCFKAPFRALTHALFGKSPRELLR